MKQFILFLFLVTSLSVQNAKAQDIGDEFSDPTLDMSAGKSAKSSEASPPDEFQPSVENKSQENITSETKTETPIEPTLNPPTTETEFHPEPLATESNATDALNSGDVVLEEKTDLTQSYKRRRGRHGVLFSLNYEKFNPAEYYSQYRDAYIEEFLGDSEAISLISIELGYKMNFTLGSLAILGNYAHGSKSNVNYTDGTTLRERNLGVSRYGLSANFALDNMTEEPWVVPYGQVGIHQFQVIEDDLSKDEAKETTTQLAFNYRIGLLFQLNWIEKAIDPNTQVDGLRSSGLQNTFIDVYAMTHMSSSETYDPADPNSEGDPDMSTGMELGVGLKMEF